MAVADHVADAGNLSTDYSTGAHDLHHSCALTREAPPNAPLLGGCGQAGAPAPRRQDPLMFLVGTQVGQRGAVGRSTRVGRVRGACVEVEGGDLKVLPAPLVPPTLVLRRRTHLAEGGRSWAQS